VFSVLTNFFWCVIGFLQTYNGAVTAVATVAIGAFTLSLVCVTNRQAKLTRVGIEIAQKSAAALAIIEGAYVYPSIILSVNIADSLGAFQNGEISGRIQVPKETPEPFPACSALAALSSRASKTSSGVA
jgi:hypothetical protein